MNIEITQVKITDVPSDISNDINNGNICPNCGESKFSYYTKKGKHKGLGLSSRFEWYGKIDDFDDNRDTSLKRSFKRFFEPNHSWYRHEYYCHSCNCKWHSQPMRVI